MSSVCNLCRLEGGQVPDEAFELLEEREVPDDRIVWLTGMSDCKRDLNEVRRVLIRVLKTVDNDCVNETLVLYLMSWSRFEERFALFALTLIRVLTFRNIPDKGKQFISEEVS